MTEGAPPPGRWHYRPGSHWAVIGPTAAVLLVGETSLGLAERVWALLSDRSADVERVLDEMTHDGLAGLPSFVLVEHAAESVRTLVRGTAVAQLRHGTGDSTVTVSGAGFRSWHEEAVADVAEAVLADTRDAPPGGPLLPVVAGIVAVGELHLRLREASTSRESPAPAPPPPALAEQPPADPALTLDERAFDHSVAPPAEEPVSEAADHPAPEPEPGPVRSGTDDDPERTPPPVEDIYQELVAGMTRLGTVEDAAVRPSTAEQDPPDPSGPPAPEPPPADETPEPAPAPVPAPAPARAVPGGLISTVSFSSARGPRAPARPPQPDIRPQPVLTEGEPDSGEVTILRLPAGTAAERAVSPTPRAGWLPAVACPHGHLNPPESQRCRVCAADLADAAKQWVERPVIGRLRFDGPPGTIPVTGPMVIGRAPRVDGISGDDVPTMVTVPSADGDVSRSHLRIAVEGWHVLLVDLDATNGTVVTEPNGTSRRLRPGEEKMVLPGSRIVLADTVGFTFEVHE